MFHCISSNNSHLIPVPPPPLAHSSTSPSVQSSQHACQSSVTLSPSLMNPFSSWYSNNSLGSYYNAIGFSRSDMKHVFPDLRIQLIDQLKTLDTRLETQVQLTNEIQEFFKKRAEVEMETSRALEKLARNLNTRHKEIKAKRDSSSASSTSTSATPLMSSSMTPSQASGQSSLQPWTVFNSQSSLSVCWQQLINDTKIQSQNHAVLADIYSTEITQRLQFVSEDLQRIYKQCREIGLEAHEELLKVLHELHTSMKTYHTYQTEARIAEAKLKLVEAQRAKLETQIPKEKLEKSKKMKLVEKEVQKRMHKFTDARFKSQKAKNEYILCMDAANAAVQKYFMEDLSDLIDCMDLGFYECVTRCFNMYVSSQDQIRKSLQTNMENMSKCVSSLDARLDKQKFLESHNTVFALPKKFEFVSPTYPNNKNTASIAEEEFTPDPPEIETSGFIRQELEQRVFQLHKRLETLRMESDELWKTLETAENSLLEMITAKDYDTCSFFIERGNRAERSESGRDKMRSDKQETDEFHLNKFRDYMLTMNRISRLQSKYEHIRKTLKTTDPTGSSVPPISSSSAAAALAASTRQYNRRKRIGQIQKFTNTRLFGGSLEEYLEKTNQEIPLIMKSCIRVINLYGLHHQGIFRVSGSQVEINNFKEAFEKGEDPLADVNDASDINSVAGVFKLYLRELREPLFPICYFEQFMELAQLDSNNVFISRMRDLVRSLPRAVFIVLRYLFAFLNHLSEYSDENMMDPYNLAICFGPTLVPVPEDKDQVQYQNLVNELIKNVILFHDEIFVDIPDGVFYEKYITSEDQDGGSGDRDDPPEKKDHTCSPVLKNRAHGGSGTRSHSREDSNCSSMSGGTGTGVEKHERSTVMSEEEESEYLEAIAQFDFSARSPRELSLKKGETLVLYAQVSSDWWKGANRKGDEGLIPDKYIVLRIRDDDTTPIPPPSSTSSPPQRSSTPSSVTSIPPPLTTPPSQQQTSSSQQTSRIRTQSDSLITTPVAKASPLSQEDRAHTHVRSFSVSADDRTSKTNGEHTENGELLTTKKQLTRSSTTATSAAPPPPQEQQLQHQSPSPQPPPQQQQQQSSKKLSEEDESKEMPTSTSPQVVVKSNIQFWESRLKPSSQQSSSSAAPDLVMDLPSSTQQPQATQPPIPPTFTDTSPSSSDESDSSESTNSESSPTTPRGSNAEVFAKQKNATLKKRIIPDPQTQWPQQPQQQQQQQQPQPPLLADPTQRSSTTLFTFSSTFNKPQVKVKPVVLSKPKLPREFTSSLNKMDEDGEDSQHPDSEESQQQNDNNKGHNNGLFSDK